MAKNNQAAKTAESKKEYKLGAYICVVDGEGFAFFNKRRYKYGDRVVVDSEELLDKMIGSGMRFIPEEDFERADNDLVKKIRSASSGNKTVEDIVRATEAEKARIKAEYEEKLAALRKEIETKKGDSEGEGKKEAEGKEQK